MLRILVLSLFLVALSAHAVERPELGTPARYRRLLSKNHCETLLAKASFAGQLTFARDFLRYESNDDRAGLVNAIFALFPRAEVLFSDQALPDGQVNRNSNSYRLRRRGHREADRTLTSLVLLQKIILGEGPEAFLTPIAPLNPGAAEITRIRQIVFDFLTEQKGVALDHAVFAKVKLEKLHALIVRLIIHDQGKFDDFIEEYRARLRDEGIDIADLSADHDVLMADIQARYPHEMMPTVTTLLPGPRAAMLKSDIGAFNPGRLFQFEAPAAHLAPLARLDKQAFQFSLIKEIFDAGGARGSEFPDGSFWIKPVITSYFRLYDDYAAGLIGPRKIKVYYNDLLRSVGAELGLPTVTAHDIALVKLARLFRLNQFPVPARGRRVSALQFAFGALDPSTAQFLIEELSKSGVDDGLALTFGYVPQVAENIQTSLGVWIKKDPAEEEALNDAQILRAMTASLEILNRATRLARASLVDAASGEFTLEMPKLADFVKVHGVEALLSGQLVLRSAGRNSAEVIVEQ